MAAPRTIGESPTARGANATWVFASCLAVIPLVSYVNSLDGALVLDSKQLVLNDPRIRQLSSQNLGLIFSESYWWPYGESGLYRPVTSLSYLLNYSIFGNQQDPTGYHVVNLGLHIANVWLVFFLTKRLFGLWASLAMAAIWSVLPLSTEAVTNIPGRADLLAAAVVLLGMLIYVSGRSLAGWRRVANLTALALVSTLGNFSKESAAVLLPVLLILEWTLLRDAHSRRASWQLLASLTPPLLVMAIARTLALSDRPAPEIAYLDNPIAYADFWQGRLTAVWVSLRYLALIVWPQRLSNDYSFAEIPLVGSSPFDWIVATTCPVLVCIFLAVFRRRRDILFAAGFALAAFLPVSNLLFPIGTVMGERLMYLPSVGVVAIFVLLLRSVTLPRAATWTTAVVFTIVVIFGVRTYARNRDWQTEITLWTSAVKAAPQSAKAHRGLAEALYANDPGKSRIDEVLRESEASVALLADLDDRFNSVQDHRQAAAYHLDKVTMMRQRGASSQDVAPPLDRARQLLQRSLRIFDTGAGHRTRVNQEPKADIYRLLAAVELGAEDYSAASQMAGKGRALAPMNPLAYQLQAEALLRLGQADEAAIGLASGALITGSSQLGAALIDLYRYGPHRGSCAVLEQGAAPTLNAQCPLVRGHICAATKESVGVARELQNSVLIERLMEAGRDFQCSARGSG